MKLVNIGEMCVVATTDAQGRNTVSTITNDCWVNPHHVMRVQEASYRAVKCTMVQLVNGDKIPTTSSIQSIRNLVFSFS